MGRPKVNLEDFLAWVCDYELSLIGSWLIRNSQSKKTFGYEIFGYWKFFSEEEAHKIIEAHWKSFMSIIFAQDAKLWIDHFAPTGVLKEWLLADRTVDTMLTDEVRMFSLLYSTIH